MDDKSRRLHSDFSDSEEICELKPVSYLKIHFLLSNQRNLYFLLLFQNMKIKRVISKI